MRDFPSCFGENGVQVADASTSSRNSQNPVTRLYKVHHHGRPCFIAIAWFKSLMGHGLSISIDDSSNVSLCKAEIKPWLFSKRKGSKRLDVNNSKIEILWDFSAAKFGSTPEPLETFYFGVAVDSVMVLLLGDLTKEAYKKSSASPPPANAVFLAKREHVYGKNVYCTKAQFCDKGQMHDVVIECQDVGLKDPCLEIRIDRKRVMQVKRLTWKFRGNQTILVDGLPVEVLWDVHNLLFDAPIGNATFMFQTCVSDDKLLPWSCSQIVKESRFRNLGFTLILYAWKNE